MIACRDLSPEVGTAAACRSLDIARATFYRLLDPEAEETLKARPASPRALSVIEQQEVLDVLHSDRFVDRAPAAVYATLLDEGTYLCSVRTMYRILDEHGEVRERRDQVRHPQYKAPELLATCPNQVWSWDITKLLGPVKWSYFSLYVILDIFSRYVVGWMIAQRESAWLAERLIRETCEKQAVVPGQLTIHADRGSSMRSKPVALLLSDLGITKTHSRPHVSDDNPYSESQFKTLKYRPGFPDRFGSIEDARTFCQGFFSWYNGEHHHSGIGLLTPETVHYGKAELATRQRREILVSAFDAHPERFVRGMPEPPRLPEAAWINKPKTTSNRAEILAIPNNAPIEEVSEHGPAGDHRSRGFPGAHSSDPTLEVNGNYTKFDEQVSQTH
jgi:putative transposase